MGHKFSIVKIQRTLDLNYEDSKCYDLVKNSDQIFIQDLGDNICGTSNRFLIVTKNPNLKLVVSVISDGKKSDLAYLDEADLLVHLPRNKKKYMHLILNYFKQYRIKFVFI